MSTEINNTNNNNSTAASNSSGSTTNESYFSDQPSTLTTGVIPADENDPNDPSTAQHLSTFRALVTSKEAGVVIGKQGKNVAEMREQTEVKAGVSKPVAGVQERVLTITGTMKGVVDAIGMAAQALIESPPSGNYIHGLSPPAPPGIATIRLLISHQQMGTVIGRSGATIKNIQENCKVRMVASKDTLPNSTERVVEIQGSAQAIRQATWEVGKCLLEDYDRAAGTIPYNPQPRIIKSRDGITEGEQINTLEVPSDLVGCIIGKGGTKIQEIRRVSGARISIAREADEDTKMRLFTIKGTPSANQHAMDLLHEQLRLEGNSRVV